MSRKPAARLVKTPPSAAVFAGVARRDITPPVGIYARMWGAAKHDVSEGTHRPLSLTALAIRQNKSSPPLLLVSADLALLGDLGGDEDEKRIMVPVLSGLSVPRQRIIVNCTHTHAAPWAASSRASMPGGDKIGPYLDQVGQALLDAAREAIANTTAATMTWATGRCNLAANRDLLDPGAPKRRFILGYNPEVVADDTVVVGRVTRDSDDKVLATVVNYACHPTTLAWLNKLISPDFIGGMREVVEGHTGGAPSLFLQRIGGIGAGPSICRRHGGGGQARAAARFRHDVGARVDAPAAAAAGLQGHRRVRGALAVWWPESYDPPRIVEADGFDVPLPLKKTETLAELQARADATTDRAIRERAFRKMQVVKAVGGGRTHKMPAWCWRIGQAFIIAHPNEAYSVFQRDLRAAFPNFAVVVMNTSGPELGYLTPAPLHRENIYQAWQTPFGPTALNVLTKTCITHARRLAKRKAGK